MNESSNSRRATMLALVLVTLASTALACVWAVRVPFLQRPDELAHADYAFTLRDVGHPFVVRNAMPSYVPVAPQLQYLEGPAGYRAMRYDRLSRAPKAYGTTAFIASLDIAAPRTHRIATGRGAPMPYVMFLYPYGYYAIVAGVLSAAAAVNGDTLWWTFLTARLFNAGLLLVTLPLAFGTFRQSGIRARTALMATAAVGFFPLVSWVSGYIQPDNLSFLLITTSMYFAARTRHRGFSYGSTLALALSLGALLFTKQHYGVAAWLPALAFVATRRVACRPRRHVAAVALVAALPALCFFLSLKATPIVQSKPVSLTVALAENVARGPKPIDAATDEIDGVLDEFVSGAGFDDYWFYDFRDLQLFGKQIAPLVAPAVGFASLSCMLLFVVAAAKIGRRLARVAYRRSRFQALRLLASAVAVNCYVLTTAVILATYALTNRDLWLEGRYWYPIIVPLMIVLLRYIPTAIRPGRRPALARVFAFALFGVSLCLAPVALTAMERNFYGRVERVLSVDRLAGIVRVAVASRPVSANHVTLVAGRAMTIEGYAVDQVSGLPARRIAIAFDGENIEQISTGRPTAKLLKVFSDGALESAGFAVRLNTSQWKRGRHTVAFSVRSNDGRSLPFPEVLEVTVVAKARHV